jgi:hypothetical protein
MFCCEGFRNLVSLAGERGLAILARVEFSGKIGFVFQSRGVAYEDEAKLKPAPIDVYINIATATGLRYCSACGRKLEELVNQSPVFFRQLAAEHKKFLTSTPGL